MNKRTPAPWTAECVGDSGGENPVEVWEVVSSDGFSRVAEHLSAADARLVAAAPGMLVALIAAQGCIENAVVRRVVDAAIARATGEQP
jgi:hypothetical protein